MMILSLLSNIFIQDGMDDAISQGTIGLITLFFTINYLVISLQVFTGKGGRLEQFIVYL